MRKLIAIPLLLVSVIAEADLVPYSIQSVEPAKANGFLKLVGSGQLEVKGKQTPYTEQIYIAIRNIDSLSDVSGVKTACIINYSSENYSETISVLKQSCETIMEYLNSSR